MPAAPAKPKPAKPAPKELAPEVAAAWSKLEKQIQAAFDSLPPLGKDTVELHRSLRVLLNKSQHQRYEQHREQFPQK